MTGKASEPLSWQLQLVAKRHAKRSTHDRIGGTGIMVCRMGSRVDGPMQHAGHCILQSEPENFLTCQAEAGQIWFDNSIL